MSESLRPYLEFITETAYLAGRLTLGYYQTGLKADYKIDHSPVTIADRKSEELVRKRIEEKYPKHAIIGEEYRSTDNEGASHRWFIDPIDGTKSFVQGVPLYAILIGLEIEGEIKAGAAYFPALQEMLAAASGEGCMWNGRQANVSRVAHLRDGVVAYTDIMNFETYGRLEAWDRIRRAVYYRAGWGDAYGYALVATGRAELMLDPVMNSWDCGPFPVILKEAGCYFGDWQGHETIYAGEALATTSTLLPEVLGLMRT
jgi:myo-inositol-1(or 4)-monophosphatase